MCDSAQSRTLSIVIVMNNLALKRDDCIYSANFYECLKLYKIIEYFVCKVFNLLKCLRPVQFCTSLRFANIVLHRLDLERC